LRLQLVKQFWPYEEEKEKINQMILQVFLLGPVIVVLQALGPGHHQPPVANLCNSY